MFSVVIPTRHRPALLQRALDSICAQDLLPQEVIIVVDGAAPADCDAYRRVEASFAAQPVRWLHLPYRTHGHGPSFTRNQGAAAAQSEYLAFLDDDDQWSDAGHLRRLQQTVQAQGPVDLYMTAQTALHPDGRRQPGPLWLDGLEVDCPAPPDAWGNRRVTVAMLARRVGFSHLNCSVYRRAFFRSLGGLDELLRYEEDRDLYLRAIDAADVLLYNPSVTALHHVPDRKIRDNASTTWDRPGQLLQQMRVFDKCIVGARHPALRQQARTLKAYVLHDIALWLQDNGRLREAAAYRREALAQRLSLSGLCHTVMTSLRALGPAPRT